jgi:DNA repair exonuclease SbcCD nuclease subunit
MNILYVGDLHIQINNFDEIDLLLQEIKNTTQNNPVESIVLLGDILHTFEKVLSPCLNKACSFIKQCSDIAHTYVLVGNHDYINNGQCLTEQHWLNPLKQWNNITIVDKIVTDKTLNVLLCPYIPNGKLVKYLNEEPYWKEYKVVFCHQEFKGAKMGAFISTEGDEWNDEYPLVISGHIHEEQRPFKNVYYVGSPLQHGYNDCDRDKVFGLVTLEEKVEPYITRIPVLSIPKKCLYKTNIKDITTSKKKYDKNTKIVLNETPENFSVFKTTEQYKNMVNNGVQFKLQKNIQKIEKERKIGNFKDILTGLVLESKNENVLLELKKLF